MTYDMCICNFKFYRKSNWTESIHSETFLLISSENDVIKRFSKFESKSTNYV